MLSNMLNDLAEAMKALDEKKSCTIGLAQCVYTEPCVGRVVYGVVGGPGPFGRCFFDLVLLTFCLGLFAFGERSLEVDSCCRFYLQ